MYFSKYSFKEQVQCTNFKEFSYFITLKKSSSLEAASALRGHMQLLQTLPIFIKLTEFLRQAPLPPGWQEIWSDQLGTGPFSGISESGWSSWDTGNEGLSCHSALNWSCPVDPCPKLWTWWEPLLITPPSKTSKDFLPLAQQHTSSSVKQPRPTSVWNQKGETDFNVFTCVYVANI